jgi:hypothetical protein
MIGRGTAAARRSSMCSGTLDRDHCLTARVPVTTASPGNLGRAGHQRGLHRPILLLERPTSRPEPIPASTACDARRRRGHGSRTGPASSMSWHTDVKHVPDQDKPGRGARMTTFSTSSSRPCGPDRAATQPATRASRSAPARSRRQARYRRGHAPPTGPRRRRRTVGLRPTPRPSPKRAAGRRSPRHGHPEGYTTPARAASSTSLGALPAWWQPCPARCRDEPARAEESERGRERRRLAPHGPGGCYSAPASASWVSS